MPDVPGKRDDHVRRALGPRRLAGARAGGPGAVGSGLGQGLRYQTLKVRAFGRQRRRGRDGRRGGRGGSVHG